MYLKRLESVGFKSFAERINVDFVPGVTAVVGPNGSGKSNITDALRWVLGEQSAKSLRGGKMEDIIFQGSDTRKPLNVAEVSLVLDNSDHTLPLDYEEIGVKRRVYRSGESEFYLNEQACRLKDIVDLFMDSGLGKEAFSIIGQGQVEEILSSKAEERRTIFEEAAGVLKYKQRKKKAEYKLAETQENLNRVDDIIYEIDQQIGSLQTQAETAKTYLTYKDQLKKQEISLFVTEIDQLYSEWQALKADIDTDKQQAMHLKASINQKEAKIEAEKKDTYQLDERIETMQSSLLEITQELEKITGEQRVLDEQSKHYTENVTELTEQQTTTNEQINQTRDKLHAEEAKQGDLRDQVNETKTKTDELKNRLGQNDQAITDQIENLKTDYIEYLNRQAAKRNERHSIDRQIQQISQKNGKHAEKFSDLLKKRDTLKQESNELEQRLSDQEQELEANEKSVVAYKQKKTTTREQYQTSYNKLNEGYQYLEKMKSKVEMLEDMKQDFQGFFNGVKAVLKARDHENLSGIHGAVIELIDVPKPYITAMETVLGGQAQHIVTEHDKAARQAIEWLKKTNNGRATFLPLASIKPRTISQADITQIQNHHGFVGVAADLIDVPDAYDTIVRHLMGHVIIASSLKDANDIAKLVKRKFRVVTLDGDVVNPGGSMSGGAQKKTNQSLFTRDQELLELKQKLTSFQTHTTNFEERVHEEERVMQQTETTLEKLQEEGKTIRDSLQDTKAKLREITVKQSALNDQLTLYDQNKQQSDDETDELNNRQTQLTSELTDLEQQLTALNERIETLTTEETTFKANQTQMEETYHNYQVALAEEEQCLRHQHEKTDDLKQQLRDLQATYDTCTKKLDELQDANKQRATIDELQHKHQTKQKEKERATQEIQEMRSTRQKQTQWIDDEEREMKDVNKQYQSIAATLQEKEVKANRLDVELENRLTHLQEAYTLTYERAKQSYDKTHDTEQLKQQVSGTKQAIARLGHVNLGAIDEYDRISERHTFLTEQQRDLVEAKETLYQVISEMDTEMESRFQSTFTQIQQEFTHVFKELFGGGRAELKLTDPTNLLETGVDIVAEPPGKKLQHLGLLSGGERALTAIALLFAILRVRPVPFCVLDEVEAALDEANVSRFSQYVKMYSEDTQFIVITHRKGTMEAADVLYGVTMQESGVSRFVSVRLEETEELMTS